MRLIDADVLCEYWHISEKCEECHWNNRDCSKPPYYSLHDICGAIYEVPTIDAIPMDWLDDQIHGYAARLQSTELKALLIVKGLWEKDQEAKS